jgi:hypothetical protein
MKSTHGTRFGLYSSTPTAVVVFYGGASLRQSTPRVCQRSRSGPQPYLTTVHSRACARSQAYTLLQLVYTNVSSPLAMAVDIPVSMAVGMAVGVTLGIAVGMAVGVTLGIAVGMTVGMILGIGTG